MSKATSSPNEAAHGTPTRWYRLPIMWLVVALPLLSFVGGGVMVALTFVRPDTEVYSERLDAPPAADEPGT